MLGFPKKFFTSLEVLLHVALAGSGHPLRSKEICALFGVSERYLEQVMQKLVRAQLLRSVRGPKGGYVLARERRKITLEEIWKVTESWDREEEKDDVPHKILSNKLLNNVFYSCQEKVFSTLKEVTLEELCKQKEQTYSAVTATENTDFII